jgi:hypothetical protein
MDEGMLGLTVEGSSSIAKLLMLMERWVGQIRWGTLGNEPGASCSHGSPPNFQG